VAATESSVDFEYSQEHIVTEPYNAPLATFATTQNRTNNGAVQARELGAKVLNYVTEHVHGDVRLRFHSSPYRRCCETIKFMLDYIVKQDLKKRVDVVITVDHVLSEWLSAELDANFYPPNDNGESLMSTAVQYLHSNVPFNRNDKVKITLELTSPYKHGNPGPFCESFIHQYARLSRGMISIVKDVESSPSHASNVILLMTHGACVRSLVSKVIGKSLFAEIPLASATLVKPISQESNRYYWKLIETDIELRHLSDPKPVDLFTSHDPFQDVHTTFHHSQMGQLDFKSGIPASKTENFNRIRSQSLLNPKVVHDSDSESDSDDEGLSFNVQPGRRSLTPMGDAHRRFRSSSLFGPMKNNFFDDSRSRKNSFERTKHFLKHEREPTTKILSRITPMQSMSNITPTQSTRITPVQSSTKISQQTWRNIDIDDGKRTVPDLEQMSSNNSSSNSLHENSSLPVSQSQIPLDSKASIDSISTEKEKSPSLFDRELIEESLKKIHESEDVSNDSYRNDWMNFKDSSNSSKPLGSVINNEPENKFKIDLYGKKNRNKLSLYDSDEEQESSSGWFLGSNRY
jgi:broad specificity phosphatase PhoE